MKRLILILFLCVLSIILYSQQVTLKGKKFYLNGSEFYPMCVHYKTEGFKYTPDPNQTSNYELLLSPDHSYYTTNGFECNTYEGCFEQIQQDFNYMSQMGFNSVRVVLCPEYNEEDGLCSKYIVPGQLPPYIPVTERINPDDSEDPGLVRMLNFYESILQCANNAYPNPLKIIFLMAGGQTEMSDEELYLRTIFLDRLSLSISQSPNKSAFFAYDLYNEPYWGMIGNKTKSRACEVVSTWYDVIKANDPTQLVTLGSGSELDIFDYDLSILKLDFISFHYYPSRISSENNGLASIQQLRRLRTLTRLYWLNNNTIRPWIIGETGFTNRFDATDSFNIANHFDGTKQDLADYTGFSLNTTCGCGGSGYTWFCYQDVAYDAFGTYWYHGNFFGMLQQFHVPSPEAEKQIALDSIRYYTPKYDNYCPVDYSPTYDSTKLYYNPFGLTNNSNHGISGYVLNSIGQPIKDAVIVGSCKYFCLEDSTYQYPLVWTFSDTNGYFKLFPEKYNSVELNFYQIKCSAIGADVVVIGNGENTLLSGSSIITLHQLNFDKSLNNIVLNGPTITSYEAVRRLFVKSVTLNTGSNTTFKASNEIVILPSFQSLNGSNATFKIENVFVDCSQIPN